MGDVKTFYLGILEQGWPDLEQCMSAERAKLIIDYASNALEIAQGIGARRETLQILARKIKPHRKSLEKFLTELETELSEKEEQLETIDGMLRPSEKRKPKPSAPQSKRSKTPRKVSSKPSDDAETVGVHSYEQLQDMYPQLTPDYIEKVKACRQHGMLKGSHERVSKEGLREWETFFHDHRHYTDLTDMLVKTGVKPETIKKRHKEVKKYLTPIGGAKRGAIYAYSRDDEQAIKNILLRGGRQVSCTVQLDEADRNVMKELKTTAYGLTRLVQEQQLRRVGNEYEHKDVRRVAEALEGFRILDDDAAELSESLNFSPKQIQDFIEVVYSKMNSAGSGTLGGYSMRRFGSSRLLIYNPLQFKPEDMKEKALKPLLDNFLKAEPKTD